MSGFPLIKPTDAAKYRREYQKILDLQIKLNKDNYDANILYQKTGTPQQPLDTRTQDEKLQDTQQLRIQANRLLQEIMDGSNAQQVLNEITPDSLLYLVSSFPKIKSILKPKYSLGVPTSIFLDFLDKFIAAEERNLGVEEGIQQSTGNQLLMNTQLILQSLVNNSDLTKIEQALNQMSMGSIGLKQSILREIKDLKDSLPTIQELREINNLPNELLKEEIHQILNDSLSNVPSKEDLQSAMQQLETAVRIKDGDAINSALTKLNNLMAVSSDLQDELQAIKQLVQGSQSSVLSAVERRAIFIPSSELETQTKDQIVSYFRRLLEIPELELLMIQPPRTKTEWTHSSKQHLIDLYRTIEPQVREFTREPMTPIAQPLFTPEKMGKGIMGRGLAGRPATRNYPGSTRPARSDRITYEDVDWSKGLAVLPRFIPFGRYIINKKRLDDNIVSLKTRSGGFLANFKSQKVSHNLGKVFRTILGGGLPSYEDINDLTEDEKEYLHRVAKASDIIDRLNIPSPNKKEHEQELNKFEIMKGEILAGNDSTELIKKFKILLLKLTNKNLIPSREAKDLLFDLTTMGY